MPCTCGVEPCSCGRLMPRAAWRDPDELDRRLSDAQAAMARDEQVRGFWTRASMTGIAVGLLATMGCWRLYPAPVYGGPPIPPPQSVSPSAKPSPGAKATPTARRPPG